MQDELLATLQEVDADPGVRAISLTGAGRAFCAGIDMSSGAACRHFRGQPSKGTPPRHFRGQPSEGTPHGTLRG